MNHPLLKAVSSQDSQSSDGQGYVPQGLGETLKALRTARSLSLGDVSARLKFSTRQIEALENENWDSLPKGLPLRGMVKNYGRYLETDIDALLVMLDTQLGVAARPGGTAISERAAMSRVDLPLQSEAGQRSWGWLIVILILLLVAAFYALERGWIPDSWLVVDWLKSLKQ